MPATEVQATTRPRSHSRKASLKTALRYAFLTLGAFIVLFPVYMAVVNSLLEPSQIAHQPPPFFPTNPQWHTYPDAWKGGSLGIYLRNSAIQTAIIVAGQLVTSILAAYAFAFLDFPFKRAIFFAFLMTLMIPFEVTVATNLTTVTSQFVIDAYHQLWRIEKSFRMSKHDLQARPIYHYTRDSIEAHLSIVVAAMAVSHYIETQTCWSIKKFVRTARRYRTVQIRAGRQILTAADPLPDDLRAALARIGNGLEH